MTSWDAAYDCHSSFGADGTVRRRRRHLRLFVLHSYQPDHQGTSLGRQSGPPRHRRPSTSCRQQRRWRRTFNAHLSLPQFTRSSLTALELYLRYLLDSTLLIILQPKETHFIWQYILYARGIWTDKIMLLHGNTQMVYWFHCCVVCLCSKINADKFTSTCTLPLKIRNG